MKRTSSRLSLNRAVQALAVVLLALFGVLVAGCHRHKPAAEPHKNVVRVVSAESLDAAKVTARSEYIAMLKGDVETELSFKVGGILEVIGRTGETLDWQEGARIAKGEILARLKREDFVSSVKSAFAKAEMDRQQHAREIKLRETGAVSQQELEAAAASRQASDASLAVAEQALKDSVLLAPYDGTIVARFVNGGETIGVGKSVLRIADLQQMSVELGIPDRLIGRVRVGKEFPVRVTTLEARSFIGRVSEVGVAAKDGARLFRVVIKISNPDGVLRSGMTATVAFDDYDNFPRGSVLIPLSALVSASKGKGENQLAVFVVGGDGKAHERPVKTDDLVRSSVIVTEGLKPGERVVTAGASTLYEGALVDARSEEKL
jgi:RND family efflux transporter MFP subunit